MDCHNVGGQVVESLATLSGDAARRHIEIASKVEGHRSVQNTAHRRDVLVSVSRPDPLEHLMKRVDVGENVMCCLPIGVLVGIAEARHPKRRPVSQRSAKVSRSGAGADRRLESVNDSDWVVTKQLLGERNVVGPAMRTAARSEQFRQFAARLFAQRNEINRLAPGGRFLGATGRYHLADDSRQHGRRVLPADQVEALERLIDEVKRVPVVGEGPFRRGCQQSIGEHGRRQTGRNRREQCALGRLAAPSSNAAASA